MHPIVCHDGHGRSWGLGKVGWTEKCWSSVIQGSQFISLEFTQTLQEHGVKISMDGKGRYSDNIFVERLWRTVKYEEVGVPEGLRQRH